MGWRQVTPLRDWIIAGILQCGQAVVCPLPNPDPSSRHRKSNSMEAILPRIITISKCKGRIECTLNLRSWPLAPKPVYVLTPIGGLQDVRILVPKLPCHILHTSSHLELVIHVPRLPYVPSYTTSMHGYYLYHIDVY